MKETKNPFEILNKETSSIEELYFITLWSYNNINISEENLNLIRDENRNITLLTNSAEKIKKYQNRGHLKSDLLNKRIRELRTVLYVRLISALEVFLVDSIKYAFIKNPFMLSSKTKKMEVPYSKLLSITNISDLQWDLVEKETRKLHSAGFKDIIKYYNTQIKINIADLNINLSKLEKFHDRRHLLVHRLGQTDHSYRHRYQEKELTIKIDENELIELINIIRELSLKISTAIETKIVSATNSNNDNCVESKVIFELKESLLPDILSESYSFISLDKYLRNSDLFKMEVIQPHKEYAMHINCQYDIYKLIIKVLKKLERKDIISIKNGIKIIRKNYQKYDLTAEHLERIAKILPPKNLWCQDIHKKLALILGISNSKSSRILTSILDDAKFLEILGTNIHAQFINANKSLEEEQVTPAST